MHDFVKVPNTILKASPIARNIYLTAVFNEDNWCENKDPMELSILAGETYEDTINAIKELFELGIFYVKDN